MSWLSANALARLPGYLSLGGDIHVGSGSTYSIEEEDPFCIPTPLHHAGIRYWIEEGGLVETTVRAFNLFRLHEVRQFGHLNDPVAIKAGAIDYGTMFEAHNRFVHVIDVNVVIALIVHNNPALEPFLPLLRVAALTHDALTPAGGDTIKMIAPDALNEDAHYPRLLTPSAWQKLAHLALDRDQLVATVQGNGFLGTILDLADKTAYVSRDAGIVLGSDNQIDDRYAPEYQTMQRFLQTHPYVCALWDVVEVRDGQVIIKDIDRLRNFLKFRALMFQHVYYDATARSLEFVLAKVVTEYLHHCQGLTIAKLCSWSDADLDKAIEGAMGMPYLTGSAHSVAHPRAEAFAELAAAKKREHELVAGGNPFVMIEDLSRVPNPATHYLVLDSRGQVLPFRDACPDGSEEIRALARMNNPYRLYWIDGLLPQMARGFRRKLLTWRRREVQR